MNAANGVYKGALDCAKQTVVRYVLSENNYWSDILYFLQGGGVSPVQRLRCQLQSSGQLEHRPLALL